MASMEASMEAERERCPPWDFVEGYLNPMFSDCLIRLLPEGGAAQKEAEEEEEEEEEEEGEGEGEGTEKPNPEPLVLPASTLLLACRPEYFKALFAGGFRESADRKKEVIITLDPADFSSFKDVLFYYYSGHLPPSYEYTNTTNDTPGVLSRTTNSEGDREQDRDPNVNTIERLIQVMRLADRFSFLDCLELCSRKLKERSAEFNASEAEAVVCLPEALLKLPDLKLSVKAAKQVMVREAASLLATDFEEDPDTAFLRLPEPCILAILDSDLLNAKSEDVVCHSVRVWADKRTRGTKSNLAVLGRVLPRIRFQFMSVERTADIIPELSDLLGCSQKSSGRNSAAQELLRSAQVAEGCSLSAKGCAARNAALASQCLDIIALACSEPGEEKEQGSLCTLLSSLGRCARLGYSPRSAVITLELPLSAAEGCSEETPVARSSSKQSLARGWAHIRVNLSANLSIFLRFSRRGALLVTLAYALWHSTPDGKVHVLDEDQAPFDGQDWWEIKSPISMSCKDLIEQKEKYFPGGMMTIRAQVCLV